MNRDQSPMLKDPIMQFFEYDHLPVLLQKVSKPFCELAYKIVGDERGMPEGTSTQFPLPRSPERTVALRKLLEAKDAAVRAALYKEMPLPPNTTIKDPTTIQVTGPIAIVDGTEDTIPAPAPFDKT